LSKRQVLKSAEGKRKRLVLVNPEDTSRETEEKLNSAEESQDEDVNNRSQRNSVAESETEKHDESHDGVRRSQRAKRQIYTNYNDSWIFAEKNVKVRFF
jgi:hypothetical protein